MSIKTLHRITDHMTDQVKALIGYEIGCQQAECIAFENCDCAICEDCGITEPSAAAERDWEFSPEMFVYDRCPACVDAHGPRHTAPF